MAEFQEAVQSPSLCFQDAELSTGTPVTNKLGLPRPICGQFASVYDIKTGNSHYAVKCFLRNIPNQHDRYAKISEHLNRQKTPHFTTFEYQNNGIRVHGDLYPLVKMAWVEAVALNEFIEKNLSKSKVLIGLESRWLDLLQHLRDLQIAHGDLQHGNVLVVENGNLRLIDYDGMWVPALKGQQSHEVGHPDYQSPMRTGNDFHEEIDFFAGTVIQIAIRALTKKPELWKRYNNGENLLFRRQDYLKPSQSQLFSELKTLGDNVIVEKLEVLLKALGHTLPRGGELSRSGGPGPESEKKSTGKMAKPGRFGERSQATQKIKPGKLPPTQQPTGKIIKPSKIGPESKATPPRSLLGKTGKPGKTAKGNKAPRIIQPGKTPPPRPLKSVGAQRAPAPRVAGPSWLTDHMGEAPAPRKESPPRKKAAPAAPRSSSSNGHPIFFRLVLHFLVLTPVAVPPVAKGIGLLSTQQESITLFQWILFGAAAFLGLLSVCTLPFSRKYHRKASGRFFGFMALMVLYYLFAKLWSVGGSNEGSAGQFVLCISLFILCVIGWLIRPAPSKKKQP